MRLSENGHFKLFIWIPDTFPLNYSRKYTFPSESTEYGSSTAVCGQVGNDKSWEIHYYRNLANYSFLFILSANIKLFAQRNFYAQN
jgi:hypothetical protein